jgi:tetratricopeptide (TPR) repeat protein
MATVDVVKLGLALPLGYLAAKLAPNDPASATTAATVAASLIGGAAGNFAHQALDAPTSALFARVFKAGTGLDENHSILLALRGAHLDALAEVAERAALRLDGGDRDAGFLSYRAGLDGYLGAARQKITPAGFAVPSAAERAVFDGLPEAFSAGLAERGADDADARDMRASVEAAVLAELRADLREEAPASFAAAFAGSDAPGDDGWFGAFVRAASARLKDNAAFATIWTANRVARIEGALARQGDRLDDIAGRMATEDAAERRHREVLAKQDEILATVSREKGVDPEHLRPILERLGHQNVSVLDMPRVLAGAVDQLQAMARERTAPSNDGADIDAAIARAKTLLASADAVGAVAELDRALDEDDVFQAAVKRRVRLLKEKAEIQRAAYDHEGALATLAEVTRLDPDQTWRHIEAGDICVTVGRLGAARRHYEAAFAAAERSGDARDVSVCYDRVGNCLRDAGDRDGALAAYRAGLAIREALARRDPGNTVWQRDLSISHWKVGYCLVDAGDRDGALAAYRNGLAITEGLAGRDPDNTIWQRDLSVSHNNIGDCLRDAGDRNGALTAYRAGQAIRETLAARDPGNMVWQRDLSISHIKIGDCLVNSGDRDGALAAYRAGLAIREALAARDPDHAVWQRDLSVSHDNIGDCLRDAGDRDGALIAYCADLAIAEALAKRDPGNAEWQRDLIVSNVKLSGVDLGNAVDHLAAALGTAQKLSATGRLAPVDAWMPDILERLLAAAQAKLSPPLTSPSPPSDNP